MALCCAGRAVAAEPVVIRPNTDVERRYLVADHGALREVGYDPECRFTRVADGPDMFYTYRFAPGRGHAAYLLIAVGSQFRIDASVDGGSSYSPVCDFLSHELVGTRVFVDLTPYLRSSDTVLVRFRDRNPEDGWGALLAEIYYYDAGQGADVRRTLSGQWTARGKPCQFGAVFTGQAPVRFSTAASFPACARSGDRAIYLGGVTGEVTSVTIGKKRIPVSRTWNGAWWADASSVSGNGPAQMVVTVRPVGSCCSIAGPVRAGLRLPACAMSQPGVSAYRQHGPYTPEKMNALGGNFLQCLLDDRYDLLAFQPGERMPIHFVHDTLRSLAALGDEERACGVARVELARRLYRGCKRAIMPGGENLIAMKHDMRPIDIRPLPGTPCLTLAHKLDEVRMVASVSLHVAEPGGAWRTPTEFEDSPVTPIGYGGRFERTWRTAGRAVKVVATYPQGDADRPPTFDVALDGRGPLRVAVGSLERSNMWLTPGSWGPEAVVLPDGKVAWSAAASGPSSQGFTLEHPAFRYLLVRGGNTGEYTFCRAVLLLWDGSPTRIVGRTVEGGRSGRLCTEIAVEYANDRPGSARVVVLPFDGFPEGLRTPRAIADHIAATGRYGVGVYDPVVATQASGPGADGFAAAAYLLRKYHTPEAVDAERVALAVMRSAVALDEAGTRTNQLYHLIHACEYMRLLGHPEYDCWARIWADRLVTMQTADGSWPWLNYQVRCMIALTRAWRMLGDQRYRAALDRALTTLEYRDNVLYWKGKREEYDDFAGAGTMGVFAANGKRNLAVQALQARKAYVDDRGFSACSDLNPYMLGFSARGLRLRSSPTMVLGLTDFAWYDGRTRKRLSLPTAYVVNPHHPIARRVRFLLPGVR